MHWWVRDGVSEFEFEFVHARAPATDDVLDPTAAAALIARLARDPSGMDALRRIHVDLAGGDSGRSLSELVLVADVIDAIHRGRLVARPVAPRLARTDPLESRESSAPALQELAQPLTPAPTPAAAPPLTEAVEHQIAILVDAARSGVPFCEECECE